MIKSKKIECVNPKNLDKKDYSRIHEITQDLWAESFWEFAQCKCCWLVISKNNYFWHLSENIKKNTIKKIMSTLSLNESDIRCTKCWWNTDILFWEEYLDHIIEKYKGKKSILVLLKDDNWEIVWFNEWYTASLDYIYNEELKPRYNKFWLQWIENEIKSKLWFIPKDLFIVSWVWILNEHKSWFNLFWLMNEFTKKVKSCVWDVYWIAENDCEHVMEKITAIYWIKLDFDRKKITNTNETYNSQLYIIPNVWESYNKLFGWTIKDFIRIKRSNGNN